MNYKAKAKEICAKGKDYAIDLTSQWTRPSNGNYVSYKEITAYSVGGMGKEMVLLIATYLGLGIGNTLFGSVLGIRPTHIQTMSVIVSILDIFLIALRAYVVDNTNTRWGRFRPYIVLSAIPLFLISAIFMYLPFDTMTYTKKLMIVFCFSLAVVVVRPYFEGPFNNIGNVITPNTRERSKVLTIYSILFSLAPTVYGFIIPVFSKYTGGYTDIRTYQYIIVPIAALGVFLSFFAAFGTRERFIVPKGYKPKVNIFKTSLEVFKNKYWWIRTLSNWLAFMEWSVGNIFLWSFVYGSQDMDSFAIYNFFIGEAALIAMVLTPIMLQKLGNRKLIVIQNVLNIFFLAFIMLTFQMPFIFFIFWWLNSFVNYFSTVYKPIFGAEVNDYQHYISGKRIDGVMSFAGLIGLPITIATGYFAPAVFEAMGITTNYDILFDPAVRNRVFTVLSGCAIIGAVLNLLPLFFYDYSRSKHRNIVKVLCLRAMLADYSNNSLTDATLKRGLDGYYSYFDIVNAEVPDIKAEKLKIKEARALPNDDDEQKLAKKLAIKAANKNLTAVKELVEEKKEAVLYAKELNKFEDHKVLLKLKLSTEVVENGLDNLVNFTEADYKTALENAKECSENKADKKILIKHLRNLNKSAKRISKNYPDGLVEPDEQEYIDAQSLPHSNKTEINIRYKAIKSASIKLSTYKNATEYFALCKEFFDEYNVKQDFHLLEVMYAPACEKIAELEAIEKAKYEAEKLARAERLRAIKDSRAEKKQDKLRAKGKLDDSSNYDNESTNCDSTSQDSSEKSDNDDSSSTECGLPDIIDNVENSEVKIDEE